MTVHVSVQATAPDGRLTLDELIEFAARAKAQEVPGNAVLMIRTKGLTGCLSRIETAPGRPMPEPPTAAS